MKRKTKGARKERRKLGRGLFLCLQRPGIENAPYVTQNTHSQTYQPLSSTLATKQGGAMGILRRMRHQESRVSQTRDPRFRRPLM